MLELNLDKELRSVKGNEPLLLDDPQTVWLVKSGTIALFATQIEPEAQGNRRYLFSVGTGEALLGSNLQQHWGFLAVALEATQLLPMSIADFSDLIANNDSNAIASLEGWIKSLGEVVGTSSLKDPGSLLLAERSRYLSLQKGQALSCAKEQALWVRLSAGNACWMGLEDLRLEENSSVFPLVRGMWFKAEDAIEVQVTPTAELETTEQLPISLERLHAYFFEYLSLLSLKQKEEEFRQFQQRQRLNRQLTEVAIGELTTTLQSHSANFFQEGEPLLVAAGAVGRAQKITVRPFSKSEDPSRVGDPLDAIARASQFRTRRVALSGDWWNQEHGPLLAYTHLDNSPVALLPDKDNRYVLFDPSAQTRQSIDKAVAQTLLPEAQMFYRPLPQFVRNAVELFGFGSKGYEKNIIAIIVLGIAATLLGMVVPQATAILVNDAIPDSDRVQLWQIGIGLFAAAIGQAVFQIAQAILSLRVENAADGVLQPAVWDRLLALKPAFFRSFSSGDLLTRLLAVNQIRVKLSGATQRTLLSAVFSMMNLGLMFVYSLPLTLTGIGLTLVAIIVTATSSTLIVRKERKQEEIDGEINGLTVELIAGVSKLRVAAAEGRAFAAWAKKYSQLIKIKNGIKRIDDSVSVFNEALPLVSSILMFWFAILFIQMAQAKGESGLNMGSFLAFNAAFGIFISGVVDLSNTLTDILGVVPLWERAKPIVQEKPESLLTQADPGRLTGKIALEHITFRYREDGPLILDDVSIRIEPGEFIAIVGPSGSGKSTIFRFLLGFETPLSGTVYYDGQDLAGLDIQAVRRQLGVVLQNGRINAGSMFDNISCGALVTLDEAWEAARMAGFAKDIEQMPMGMHTVISEGGANLSGGQRQRLLIARAIVLKPKIILMDEATSALDNRTQAIVTESLDKLNATRVVIAHRLSTIRNADRIYVIEAGRLVEFGSFEELVARDGLFARLATRQLTGSKK
jgi:NHLM bacteriocin system ABC transporter ATP-binding protein